jgi:RNA polymerase sigma-70 factor (ECF subfamily)
MSDAGPSQVTELLRLSSQGDASAEAMLMKILDGELRKLAINCMKSERRDHTLQPTALVNEAYLRLVSQRGKDWKSRKHFLAVATQVMRRVLVDYARAHRSVKRAGQAFRVPLNDSMRIGDERWSEELVDLDAALVRLAELDPRQARVIELRFFGGLTDAEIAEALGISERTVQREWKLGRAWLYSELNTSNAEG